MLVEYTLNNSTCGVKPKMEKKTHAIKANAPHTKKDMKKSKEELLAIGALLEIKRLELLATAALINLKRNP